MALAETAELAVRLTLDDRMSPAINKAKGGLRTLGSTAKTVGKGIAVGVGIGAAAGIVALTGAIKGGIEALKQDKVVAAQTAAVIKSTGSAAGVTAQQVGDLADKLSTLNGVQDDVVQNAENLLLTFTKIGGDILPETTQAVLDMSAALGQDAKSSAIQLGKALNDPLKGITALRRVGIQFTAEQEKQIAGFYQLTEAEQDHYESLDKDQKAAFLAQKRENATRQAQAVILAEVRREFDGVAKAQADADPGRRLALSTEKFQKALASGLLPVIEKVQTRLADWLIKPETIAAVTKIGDAIGALFTDENLDAVASGLEVAAKAVGTAISAFNSLPREIKALAIGAFAINKVTGGAVGGAAEAFGKLLGAGLQKIFAANVTVIGGSVTGGGGGGIPGGAAGAGAGGLGLLATAGVFAGAGGVAALGGAIAEGITGALKGAVTGLNLPGGDQTNKLLDAILRSFPSPQNLLKDIEDVYRAVTGTQDAVESQVTSGGGFFSKVAGVMRSTVVAADLRGSAQAEHQRERLAARQRSLQERIKQAQESGDNRRTSRLQNRLDGVNRRLEGIKTAIQNQKQTSITVSTRDIKAHTHNSDNTARKGSASSGDSRTYSGQ